MAEENPRIATLKRSIERGEKTLSNRTVNYSMRRRVQQAVNDWRKELRQLESPCLKERGNGP